MVSRSRKGSGKEHSSEGGSGSLQSQLAESRLEQSALLKELQAAREANEALCAAANQHTLAEKQMNSLVKENDELRKRHVEFDRLTVDPVSTAKLKYIRDTAK